MKKSENLFVILVIILIALVYFRSQGKNLQSTVGPSVITKQIDSAVERLTPPTMQAPVPQIHPELDTKTAAPPLFEPGKEIYTMAESKHIPDDYYKLALAAGEALQRRTGEEYFYDGVLVTPYRIAG